MRRVHRKRRRVQERRVGVVADIDQRYRDLVFLVKLWAKHYDVNNAMEGSFNSYSLCLLCMHHLQRRKTPILPPTMMLTLPRPDLIESELLELDDHQRAKTHSTPEGEQGARRERRVEGHRGGQISRG